jgi:hypothetical protein
MAAREEAWEPGLTDGYRCDFCADRVPVWLSPTRTHAVYESQDDHDETMATGMSRGGGRGEGAAEALLNPNVAVDFMS